MEPEAEFVPMDWDPGLPLNDSQVRGFRDIRAIVHLHSPHSHDACDGDPQPDGTLDEDCLNDLRMGLCTTRIEVAFLSEHPAHATEVSDFEELLLVREGDEIFSDVDGNPIANNMACPEGGNVLLLPGIESSRMMPLGISSLLDNGYDQGDSADFQAVKNDGGLAWIAHTEQRDVEELKTLGIEGIEVYQLHANLDPDIRSEALGLEALAYLDEMQPFFFPDEDVTSVPIPDLAPLGFLLPNEPSLLALEALGQHQSLGVSGGTDAHQNVFAIAASDGERIDSYRRMMRWFNTRLRITEDTTPSEVKSAMRSGRTWIAFEAFGSPVGFDFYASDGEDSHELGSEFAVSESTTLHITLPSLDENSPQGDISPQVRGVLFRADENGRETVTEWIEGTMEHSVTDPGVYRVEVWITPFHLLPYLTPETSHLTQNEVPWVTSGAIFIRE